MWSFVPIAMFLPLDTAMPRTELFGLRPSAIEARIAPVVSATAKKPITRSGFLGTFQFVDFLIEACEPALPNTRSPSMTATSNV